jgi:hypothetical protein
MLNVKVIFDFDYSNFARICKCDTSYSIQFFVFISLYFCYFYLYNYKPALYSFLQLLYNKIEINTILYSL